MVSTLDFESSDPSSNLGRTCVLFSIQFIPDDVMLCMLGMGSTEERSYNFRSPNR